MIYIILLIGGFFVVLINLLRILIDRDVKKLIENNERLQAEIALLKEELGKRKQAKATRYRKSVMKAYKNKK